MTSLKLSGAVATASFLLSVANGMVLRRDDPKLSCYGKNPNNYCDRDKIADVIKNQFCPDIVKQAAPDAAKHYGSPGVEREYNKDQKEWVLIDVTFPDGYAFKPNQDDCVKYLMSMILDDCDASNNPGNMKGGGQVSAGPEMWSLKPMYSHSSPADGTGTDPTGAGDDPKAGDGKGKGGDGDGEGKGGGGDSGKGGSGGGSAGPADPEDPE